MRIWKEAAVAYFEETLKETTKNRGHGCLYPVRDSKTYLLAPTGQRGETELHGAECLLRS
jgi:hypothetical protein